MIERNIDCFETSLGSSHKKALDQKTMASKKKTLTSKSAKPSLKKSEQPNRSVEKDFKSVDDEKTINALLDGSYHLPGNGFW